MIFTVLFVFFVWQVVPCNITKYLAWYIDFCKAKCVERGLATEVLRLHTAEEKFYEVEFRHGRLRSEIYGPGWEEFVNEYGLYRGDRVVVGLEFFGLSLVVDIYRGEELLLPLPWIGKLVLYSDLLLTYFFLIKISFLIFQIYSQSDHCVFF